MDGPENGRSAETICSDTEILPKSKTLDLRSKYIGYSCTLFFRDKPLKFLRGKGVWLYDERDQPYLDCINNVCHVGHCNSRVVEALCTQAALLNTNSRFLHDNLVIYAQRLAALFPDPLSVVYMVNSGSEATDLALRLAFTHTAARHVITLDHAYHGHVISAISVSPYKFRLLGSGAQEDWVHTVAVPDAYRGKFTDLNTVAGSDLGLLYADEVAHTLNHLNDGTNGSLEENNMEAAQQKTHDVSCHDSNVGDCGSGNDRENVRGGKRVAAFIAESLQSCGGQIIYPPGYLRRVYQHVREAGGVCIADEVQVGFGRVGSHWWAFQTQGDDVIPDIVTLGKPMGNGHPVSAVVTTPDIAESFAKTGVEYFNTFGGNPVSCAVALSVLDVIEKENLMQNCIDVEQILRRLLISLKNKHSCIGDVRVCGMFAGVDLVSDPVTRSPATDLAQTVVAEMRNRNVLISSDGPHRNVLKFKPPIVFSQQNAQQFVCELDAVLSDLKTTEKSP